MYFKIKYLFINTYQEKEPEIEQINIEEVTEERRSKQVVFDIMNVYENNTQSLLVDVIKFKVTQKDELNVGVDVIKQDIDVFGIDKNSTIGDIDTFRVERYQIEQGNVTLNIQTPERLLSNVTLDIYKQQNYSITDKVEMDIIQIKDDGKDKVQDRTELDFYQIFLLYNVQ